jgi:PAS domain-containing protein
MTPSGDEQELPQHKADELRVRVADLEASVDALQHRLTLYESEFGQGGPLLDRGPSGQITREAVQASEERYRDLFENANDIIFLHDLTGKLLTVNRAAEALTGYSR